MAPVLIVQRTTLTYSIHIANDTTQFRFVDPREFLLTSLDYQSVFVARFPSSLSFSYALHYSHSNWFL